MLWNGEVLGNTLRNAELIELENGVRGDDGTSRKVNSLAHEIASYTALFALQSRSDVLDGATILVLGFISCLWIVVIHDGGNLKLESRQDFLNGALILSLLDVSPELIVGSDDLLVSECEIVFAPCAISGLN